MELASILNDVIGPVMRGPSSSHTAGAFRIGKLVRDLLAVEPRSLRVTFDPTGSYAPTYRAQGVDVAFAAGVLGRSMRDDNYLHALTEARQQGVHFDFVIEAVTHSDHPNAVRIDAEAGDGTILQVGAESVGGGAIRCTEVDGRRVDLTGKTHEILVEVSERSAAEVQALLVQYGALGRVKREEGSDRVLLHARRASSLEAELRGRIGQVEGVESIREVRSLFPVQVGSGLFSSAEEMLAEAESRDCSLGRIALAYESELLGWTEEEIQQEVLGRFEVMEASVRGGLDDANADMLLLQPSAGQIFRSEAKGTLYTGGIHIRAAARAMAVMHTCNSRGVVCAAPTGGSAGVVPGVVCTLTEDEGVSREAAAPALMAGAAVGLIMAKRATFAAETAGCQVEIGVAGAMAAAAVVEVAGGSARQAADAAAIALQNTMGSVCDPVHGACEIPCHTRNALAASSAFVCADLILGGYLNAIPLDETIDASYAVGKALPRELRCTAAGGLAVTPSAQALVQLR
jgi:L-serine dehydratase